MYLNFFNALRRLKELEERLSNISKSLRKEYFKGDL